MSPYIIVGTVLLLGSLFEFLNRKTSEVFYVVSFGMLLVMLCFRYGQGTDYFAYQYIYEKLPNTLNPFILYDSSVHSEVGWKLICVCFRKLGFSYYWFVAIVGVVTMYFLNRFITEYCPLKVTALFIAYPTLYLTYISSGLRQGLVMCAFIGMILDWYLNKENKKFFVAILICSLLHTSSLVLLVLLVPAIKDFIVRNEYMVIIASWAIGILLSFSGINLDVLDKTITNDGADASIVAVAERILTYIVIRVFYNKYKENCRDDSGVMKTLWFVYCVSMIVYGLCFSMPLLSSRTCYFFKSMEIAIITTILSKNKFEMPDSSSLFLYIGALSMVMMIKNLDSYLAQGLYYSRYTMWNFPYNNIFIKEEYRYSVHQNLLR